MCAKRLAVALVLFCLTGSKIFSQVCSVLGQTPQSAFPVCGVKVFQQGSVPLCKGPAINAPGCTGLTARNPFWYKFTCFATGTFGFLITPLAANEDYDWQIFDVTGHDVNDVFTDPSLFVVGNWAGTYAPTGTSPTATSNIQCGSNPTAGVTTFSSMPVLIKGHDYLLLVSHFTDTQSGYTLDFSGGTAGTTLGTASITDTNTGKFKNGSAFCNNTGFAVSLNKKMKCSSVAADGSDFSLSVPGYTITGASAQSCSSGFDFDSLNISVDKPLTAGTYTLTLKTGSDNNTLLDNCDVNMAAGESITIVVKDTVTTKFSYAITYGCKADTVRFSHPGGIGLSWLWNFDDNTTSTLQNPTKIYTQFGPATPVKLTVSNGVCALSDSARMDLTNNTWVKAGFTLNIDSLCPEDRLVATNTSQGNVARYAWDFGNGVTDVNKDPQPVSYSVPRETGYRVKLSVENAGCVDTTSVAIKVFPICTIAVPSAFTPNGDGLNDYLYPLDAIKADHLVFRVYNRMGQVIFETHDWTRKWDGKMNGRLQPPGTYVWTLSYTHHDTGKAYFLKGTSVLIR